MESILTSIKKLLGIEETDTHFDQDIIMHINTVLLFINQIGIGPTTGFVISDATKTWNDLLVDKLDLEAVKTYVYLKVRLVFDPPTSSYVIESLERSIKEIEWRLNQQVEGGVV